MNDQDRNPALLPSGFVDLLPPDAEQEAAAVTALMNRFSKFGYRLVKPPLVEFEESLLAPGPGAVMARETFRLMDPVSHRMMGIRSDITTQIARIASTRLAAKDRPLRLMYANDVLRTNGTQQRMERQFCQVGCEMIGRESDEADIEICAVALMGIKELGIKNITLDLTMPSLVEGVFEEHKLAAQDRSEIKEALSNRDSGRLKSLKKPLQDILRALLMAAGPSEKSFKIMNDIKLPEKARLDLKKLTTVYQGIVKALRETGWQDVAITIDPIENKGHAYEQGIAFALFAQGLHGELGRGGRYDISFGGQGRTESATGFTLYMDTVRKAMAAESKKSTVFVAASESWSLIRRLQDEGWIAVRGTGQNKSREHCTHEYKDGKVQEINQVVNNKG